MYKIAILSIIISFILFTPVISGSNIPEDLNNFTNGGKIISPSGTYRSGGYKPSRQFSLFINKLGAFLRNNDQLILDIRGHSDDQGTQRINKNISTKRALYVEDLLLKNSGIKKDRIISRGYSDNHPLKSNKNDTGRMVNRRVELYLTSNKNPVGEITHIKNRVFTKPPEQDDFKKAEVFEALFNLYKLNTRKRSGANIQLSDNSKLNIGPESLMVIYEMIESELANPDAWKDKKVKLLTGFLRTKLNNLRKGIKVETPQCEIDSRSKIMLVDISKKQQSSISVFEGMSDVKASDKTVNVKSGFGTFVEEGKEPAKPEPLPSAPGIISPEKESIFKSKKSEKEIGVDFKWTSKEELNHIQISEDKEFTKIVVDEKVTGNTFNSILKGGNYSWRIAGINRNGIEGFPEVSVFSVVIKKESVPLITSPEAKIKPIDAHGSTTIVKNNSILITGETLPGAEITISYNKINVDQKGKFSKKIPLSEGWNLIKITSSHPDYLPAEKWISVCYFKKLYK